MQLNPNPKFLVLAYPSEKTPTSQSIYVCIQGNSGNSWEDLELKSNMVVFFLKHLFVIWDGKVSEAW